MRSMTTEPIRTGHPAILEPTEPGSEPQAVHGTSRVREPQPFEEPRTEYLFRVLMKDGIWLVPEWDRPKQWGRLLSERPEAAPRKLGYIPPPPEALSASRGRKGGLVKAARMRRKRA